MEKVYYKEEYIDEIDLRDLIKILGKWKVLIAGITCLFIAVSAILSYLVIEPVYEAQTQMKVAESVIQTSGNSQMDSLINQLLGEGIITMENFSTQITSPDVLKQVINKLKLSLTPAELETMIKANVDDDQKLITIIVSSHDGELSAQIANALRDEAIHQAEQINAGNMELVNQGIECLLQKEDEKLQLALQDLSAYLNSNKSSACPDMLLSEKISTLEECQQQLNEAEIERAQLNKGIQQLQIIMANNPATITETSSIEGTAAGMPDMDSGSLTVNTEKSSEVYNQALIEYHNKLTSLAEIEVKTSMLKELLTNQEQEIIQEEAALIKNKLAQMPLQSEIDRIQNNITWLNNKKEEIAIIAEFRMADNLTATIVEASAPASPVKPNIQLNLLIALILGLMLSVFAAFFLEYMARPKNEVSD